MERIAICPGSFDPITKGHQEIILRARKLFDRVIVVVSEETGIISLAKNGVLIRRLDRQNLFSLLEGDMVPPAEEEKKRPFWRRKHEKHE